MAAGIVAVMGELKAAAMAERVRVDGDGEIGHQTDAGEELSDAGRCHGPTTLGGKDVGEDGTCSSSRLVTGMMLAVPPRSARIG